jgi:glucan 1,3-beta-glucosidase
MKSFLQIILLLFLPTQAVATHGGREILEIEQVVSSMTKEYETAVTYAGPNEDSERHRPTSALIATPTPGSYWLADIRHQGVAAFNSDQSYQVFRNVKDFGAKGEKTGQEDHLY